MILRKISAVIFILTLLGCGTSKKAVQVDNRPQWVKAKPTSGTYYIGVGSSARSANIQEYQTNAKNNALADLIGEISVNISSSSVINQFENNFGYAEDFNSMVKTSSKEQLEGYQMVDSYEDEANYWVYYRLNKEQYKQLRAKRLSDAKTRALDFLTKAKTAEDQFNYNLAIANYTKGLVAVKPYLDDPLEVLLEGTTIYLGNDLVSGLIGLLNSINIEANKDEISVKSGESLSSTDLRFTLMTKAGNALAELPVVFTANKRPIKNNRHESDRVGEVGYAIPKVISKSGNIAFEAKLDMNTLAKSTTSDPQFRKMLRKFDAPKASILIKVNNPSFHVLTKEKNLGRELSPKIVEGKVNQILTKYNYPIVFNEDKADFIMKFDLNTEKGRREGRFYYVNLRGNVSVFNANGHMVLSYPLNNIEGVQLSYRDAGMDAYNKLTVILQKNLLSRLKEAVK